MVTESHSIHKLPQKTDKSVVTNLLADGLFFKNSL